MLRSFLSLVAIFILLNVFVVSINATSEVEVKLDDSKISKGILRVAYLNPDCDKAKLRLKLDGKKYYYNLANTGKYENFSMQMGNGEYEVKVYENEHDNKYKCVFKEYVDVEVDEEKEDEKYKESIQNVKYDKDDEVVKLAKKLTKHDDDDEEKVESIYKYIVKNIDYDYGKLSELPYNYVPDNEKTLDDEEGICYDYASLMAAMLRSQDIPVKLIKGYSKVTKGYHAWNEVKIDGRWIIIDTTYDSVMRDRGRDYDMQKPKSYYDKVNEY